MSDEGEEAGLRAGPASEAAPGPNADAAVPGQGKRRAPLSEQTRNRIALQLRAMYDTVAEQPVPDRFADLIARLDDADRGRP